MTNKEYNGWFNYETWLVNLWMDNDQGEHEHWREVARESIETNIALCEWYQFEDRLKDYLDQIREGKEGLAGDLIGAAIGEVNTRDIAKSWVENELEHMGINMEITE
jgi:hypothetical protein